MATGMKVTKYKDLNQMNQPVYQSYHTEAGHKPRPEQMVRKNTSIQSYCPVSFNSHINQEKIIGRFTKTGCDI